MIRRSYNVRKPPDLGNGLGYAHHMESLTAYDYKLIIARRDRRYDGRFFFGVKTTKIYCRPSCPARPKPHNILLFRSKTEAEAAGFRSCLRCRPDLLPSSTLLSGTANTVSRALRIIEREGDDDLSVSALAHRLGVSERHLRRLFEVHLGASPIAILATQRIHFAKQLVLNGRFAMSEIAMASGFQSVRRFNEAFKETFHVSPTHFRAGAEGGAEPGLELEVPVFPPYDWTAMIAFLDRHGCAGIETVTADEYHRFIATPAGVGRLVVRHILERNCLKVCLFGIPLSQVKEVVNNVRNLFDTDHNPLHLPESLGNFADGIRVPRAFDTFETAVSIVLGQVVSVERAKKNLEAIVRAYGRPVKFGDVSGFEFPTAESLARAKIERLGVSSTTASAVRSIAREVVAGRLDIRASEDFTTSRKRLQDLPGIGEWTATIIAMRCFGDPDAFPKSDRALQRMLLVEDINPDNWGSQKAYLAHALWREYSNTSKRVGRNCAVQ